jgi:hypothetical protein
VLGPVAGPAGSAPDPSIQYVDPATATLCDRPACPARPDRTEIVTGGTGAVTLSGLPVPASVRVTREGTGRSQVIPVPDGELVWDTDLPGTYTLTVQSWPFRDGVFRVTAR